MAISPFFSTGGPAGTSIETLVAVEGPRAIEDGLETARTILVSITTKQLLAWWLDTFPWDARLRHDGGDPPSRQSQPPKKKTNAELRPKQSIAIPPLIRWSIQEVLRIAIMLRESDPPSTSSMSTLEPSSPAASSARSTSHQRQL